MAGGAAGQTEAKNLNNLGKMALAGCEGCASALRIYAYVNNDPLNATDPNGLGPVGWIVELGETTMRLVRPLFSQADAVAARRSGLNVMASTRQAAGAIETAADQGAGNVIRHSGHELADESVGLPHFQSEGSTGHTFYDIGSAVVASATVVLSILDQLDPYHISSTAACDTLTCQGVPVGGTPSASASPAGSVSQSSTVSGSGGHGSSSSLK